MKDKIIMVSNDYETSGTPHVSTPHVSTPHVSTPHAKVCYAAVVKGDKLDLMRVVRGRGGVKVSRNDAKSVFDRFLTESNKDSVLSVGCVPVHKSLTLWLSAPFSSVARAKKVFPALLDIALPFPLAQCVYQFLDVRKMPDGTTKALAVAARIDQVVTVLKDYQLARLDPELLDHEGLTLWSGSVEDIPSSSDATRVVLCLLEERLVVVVGRQGRFFNAHSISFNKNEGATESVTDQVRRYLRAEMETGVVVEWAFCGTEVVNSSLVQSFYDKFAKDWPGSLLIHNKPDELLLRALGSRALYSGKWRCNLRGGGLTHFKLLRIERKRLFAGAALILAAGLFLFAVNIAWHVANARRLRFIRDEIAVLSAAVAPGESVQYGMEFITAERALERYKKLTIPFVDAFKPSLAVSLAEIARAGAENKLGFESLSLKRDAVLISGTAEDWDLCGHFAARLRGFGYAVTLDRHEAGADGLVGFSVKAERSVK